MPDDAASVDSSPSAVSLASDKVRPTFHELYENGDSDDDIAEVAPHHRGAALCASMVAQEDIRIVGPMKATTVGNELKPPRFGYVVAPFFRAYATVLTILYVVLSIAPILIAVFVYRVNWAFTIVTIVMTSLILLVSIPFFYMIVHWQPLDAKPVHQYRMRTVDILVTTYKEDMDVIIDTLEAIQRIAYDSRFLNVYVLDDGRRAELQEFVNLMNARDPMYPVRYVTRPNNKGRKGGNINHFIREYEEEASEWLIVLDADMAPFPEIFDVLFGAYYSYEKEERDNIAFIQCPQHFKNHIPEKDWYDIGMAFFYTCVMACMSQLNCTMYIGTCALWRRSAIVFGGGFHESHATEDTVTGCYVHRTQTDLLDPKSINWTSKFINTPIAAGIAPGTLPQQIDQRLRWCLGSVQMFYEHSRFLTATGLNYNQRMTYFATVGYWVLGIASFITTFTASVTVLMWIFVRGVILGGNSGAFPWWLLVLQFFSFTLYFAALPVAKQVDKLRVVQMFAVFTPVYMVAYMSFRGIKIKVQATAADSDEDTRRWHPFMWFHAIVLTLTTALGILAVVFGKPTPVNIATAVCHSGYWWILYWPVILSLFGFTQEELHPRYKRGSWWCDDDVLFDIDIPTDHDDMSVVDLPTA